MNKLHYRSTPLLLFTFIFVLKCSPLEDDSTHTRLLVVEKFHVRYGKQIKKYTKYFDDKNRPSIFLIGSNPITDSIIFMYNEKSNRVTISEYSFNEKRKYSLESKKEIPIAEVMTNQKYVCYIDSFFTFDGEGLREILTHYDDSLTTKEIIQDRLKIIKHIYKVNDKPFLLLPYSENNRGVENSETLDSLVLFCHGDLIVKEIYYFERNKEIQRIYQYNQNKLKQTDIALILSGKPIDSYSEKFTYNLK
jgi:hypothetical protein